MKYVMSLVRICDPRFGIGMIALQLVFALIIRAPEEVFSLGNLQKHLPMKALLGIKYLPSCGPPYLGLHTTFHLMRGFLCPPVVLITLDS